MPGPTDPAKLARRLPVGLLSCALVSREPPRLAPRRILALPRPESSTQSPTPLLGAAGTRYQAAIRRTCPPFDRWARGAPATPAPTVHAWCPGRDWPITIRRLVSEAARRPWRAAVRRRSNTRGQRASPQRSRLELRGPPPPPTDSLSPAFDTEPLSPPRLPFAASALCTPLPGHGIGGGRPRRCAAGVAIWPRVGGAVRSARAARALAPDLAVSPAAVLGPVTLAPPHPTANVSSLANPAPPTRPPSCECATRSGPRA
mmetsp:Transcript_20568/g.60742  ORF Transcript_20568/g.60742 Transcript_20568/m.60742 type:complete len:259 (-) Transcript_20568:35-811(-)